jgi:hypothetical protein
VVCTLNTDKHTGVNKGVGGVGVIVGGGNSLILPAPCTSELGQLLHVMFCRCEFVILDL